MAYSHRRYRTRAVAMPTDDQPAPAGALSYEDMRRMLEHRGSVTP